MCLPEPAKNEKFTGAVENVTQARQSTRKGIVRENMSDTSDCIRVLNHIKALSAQKANRGVILGTGDTIQEVVKFLMKTDPRIVTLALETILLLCEEREHRILVAAVPGLADAVKKNMFHANLSIKSMAVKAYRLLSEFVKKVNPPMKTGKCAPVDVAPKVGFFSSAVSNAPANTFNLHVKGLNSDSRKMQLEAAVIKVPGVISLLVDVFSQKVVVKTRGSFEEVVSAIRTTGMIPVMEREDQENQYSAHVAQVTYKKGSIVLHETSKKEEEKGWFGRITKSLWG